MKRGEPSKWSYCKEGGTFGGCSLPSIAGVSYPPSPTNPGLANPPSCRPTYPPSLPPHSLSRRPSASSSRRRILKHRRSLFAPPHPRFPGSRGLSPSVQLPCPICCTPSVTSRVGWGWGWGGGSDGGGMAGAREGQGRAEVELTVRWRDLRE